MLSIDRKVLFKPFCVPGRLDNSDVSVSVERLPSTLVLLDCNAVAVLSMSVLLKGDQDGVLDERLAPVPMLSSKNNNIDQSC